MCKVLSTHNADKLLHFLAKHKIRTIVVSPIKLKEIDPETDLDIFIENNIEVLTVPSMNQWHENSPMPATMRPDFKNLQIEDLLERPAIEIEKSHIVSQLQGKVVMITGAAGSIGSEIVRQLVNYKPKLIVLYDNAETPLHNLRLELEERKTHCLYPLLRTCKRFNRRPLAYCGRCAGRVAEEVGHYLRKSLVCGAVADAPAGHCVGLGYAVNEQGALLYIFTEACNAGELYSIINELVVYLVGKNIKIVLYADLADRAELVL